MKGNLTTLCIIMSTLMCYLIGCTNGGNIGPLYGVWALQSYTVDGINADIDTDEYFWQFQSDIICIVKTLPYNDYLYSFGTWEKSSDCLMLNFTHTSEDETPESSAYNPPSELGLQPRAVTDLEINKLTGSEMHLSFTDNVGQRKIYKLKKLK